MFYSVLLKDVESKNEQCQMSICTLGFRPLHELQYLSVSRYFGIQAVRPTLFWRGPNYSMID